MNSNVEKKQGRRAAGTYGRAAKKVGKQAANQATRKKLKTTHYCIQCGVYPADSPSKLCAGCEAYQEHTSI